MSLVFPSHFFFPSFPFFCLRGFEIRKLATTCQFRDNLKHTDGCWFIEQFHERPTRARPFVWVCDCVCTCTFMYVRVLCTLFSAHSNACMSRQNTLTLWQSNMGGNCVSVLLAAIFSPAVCSSMNDHMHWCICTILCENPHLPSSLISPLPASPPTPHGTQTNITRRQNNLACQSLLLSHLATLCRWLLNIQILYYIRSAEPHWLRQHNLVACPRSDLRKKTLDFSLFFSSFFWLVLSPLFLMPSSLCQIFLAADSWTNFLAHITFFVKFEKLRLAFRLLCRMHAVIQVPLKTCQSRWLVAKFVASHRCHCAAAFIMQVPKPCTDLDQSLLYILLFRTCSRFVRKN